MYKYINKPHNITKKEYDFQQSEFLNFCKNESNIISVYSIWELEFLWVSDLDYLIIHLDDNFNKSNVIKFLFQSKFNLIDIPRFLSISDISKIWYFTHRRNFKLILWKKIDFNFIDNFNFNLLFSLKILFCWVLRIYYPMFFAKKIDISLFLVNIKDLFFLKKLIPWALDNKDSDFLDECRLLFSSDYNTETLLKIETYYLPKIIDIGWKFTFHLDRLFINKMNFSKKKNEYMLYRYPSIFSEGDLINITERFWKKFKSFRFLALPLSFNYKYFHGNLKKDFMISKKMSDRYFQVKFNIFYLDLMLYIRNLIIFVLMKIFILKRKK